MFGDKGEKIFNEGLQYAINGQLRKALACFEQVPQRSKYYNEMLANKMGILCDLGEFDDVKTIFSEIKEVYPIFYIAVANQIRALLETDCAGEAVRLYRRLQKPEITDENLILFWNAATAAEQAHDDQLVLELSAYIDALWPGQAYLAVRQAQAYVNLGQDDIAEKLLRTFVTETGTEYRYQINADQFMQKALYTLMLIYNRTGKLELAKQFEREYEAQKQFEIASRYNHEGQYEQAIIYFEQVPEGTYIYDLAVSDKLMAYTNSGKYEEAEALFKQIKPDAATYYLAVINYSAVLNRTGRYEEALAMETIVSPTFQHYHVFLHNLIDAAQSTKKYDLMLKFTEILLSIDDEDIDYHYQKGLALYYLKRYQEAIDALGTIDTACECGLSGSDSIDAVYLLGCCYRNIGDNAKAETYFDQAYSLEHSSASAVMIGEDGERQEFFSGGRAPFNPDGE